jgi:hypothetical protein
LGEYSLERYFYRIPDWIGEFRSISAPIWEEYQDGVKKFTFTESQGTADWIILFDASRGIFVALPLNGGMTYYLLQNLNSWTELYNVDYIYPNFTLQQQNKLAANLQIARDKLKKTLDCLSPTSIQPGDIDEDMKQKVKDIFKINTVNPTLSEAPGECLRFTELIANYRTLQLSFDQNFPIVFEPDYTHGSSQCAWVNANDLNDPTVHIAPDYFYMDEENKPLTLIHERAHTVLRIPGHPPITNPDEVNSYFGMVDPDKGFDDMTYEDAISNPYCYEWLIKALVKV